MRKTTKRKHYARINPLAYVLEGIQPATAEKLSTLRTRELSSIEALATGRGGLREWHDMTSMLNIAETMSRAGVGLEVMAACELAQAALLQAAERYQKTKRMGLSALGLQALRDLYQWHDLQRTSVTLGEYEKQISNTVRLVKKKGLGVYEIQTTGVI